MPVTSDDVDYPKNPKYKVPTKDKRIYDADVGEENGHRISGLIDSEGQSVTGMFKRKPSATVTPKNMNYYHEDDGK